MAPQETALRLVEHAAVGTEADNATALVLDVLALPETQFEDLELANADQPLRMAPSSGDVIDDYELRTLLADARTRECSARRIADPAARSSSSFRNRGRNPILEPGGGLKLVDLGVARLRRFEEPHAVEAPGTRSYIAPELFTGTLADEASDIFALGVTLYRMFSGGGYPYGESSLSVARTSLYERNRVRFWQIVCAILLIALLVALAR